MGPDDNDSAGSLHMDINDVARLQSALYKRHVHSVLVPLYQRRILSLQPHRHLPYTSSEAQVFRGIDRLLRQSTSVMIL